jgi:hypothetical protein
MMKVAQCVTISLSRGRSVFSVSVLEHVSFGECVFVGEGVSVGVSGGACYLLALSLSRCLLPAYAASWC